MSLTLESIQEVNNQDYKKYLQDVNLNQNTCCQFYLKTSACQYGPLCYKKHLAPSLSSTLVVRNMFKDRKPALVSRDLFMKQKVIKAWGEDTSRLAGVEFKRFFLDIVPEFEKFGRVKKVLVCNNLAHHLKGNVYVLYWNVDDAVSCYNKMNGRYYGGFPLNIEYSYLVSSNEALCSFGSKCTVKAKCNFLHVFKAPRNRSRSPLPR